MIQVFNLQRTKSMPWRVPAVAALGLLLASLFMGVAARAEASDPFVRPPELEKDVRFWIRVYTEVTTDQGLLHDDWNLGLVYEVLRFDPAALPRYREKRVAEAKARYAGLLKRFAAGTPKISTPHERRILHAFGDKTDAGGTFAMRSTGFVSSWARRTAFTKG